VLQELGYTTVDKLKEVEKPGKLANDLNGYNKKNKLGLKGLSPEEVEGWFSAEIEQDITKEKQYPSLDPILYNSILKNISKSMSLHYSGSFDHLIFNYLDDANFNQKLFERIYKFLQEQKKHKKQIK